MKWPWKSAKETQANYRQATSSLRYGSEALALMTISVWCHKHPEAVTRTIEIRNPQLYIEGQFRPFEAVRRMGIPIPYEDVKEAASNAKDR